MYNDIIFWLFIGSLCFSATSLVMMTVAGIQITRGAQRAFAIAVLMVVVGSLMLIATKLPFF